MTSEEDIGPRCPPPAIQLDSQSARCGSPLRRRRGRGRNSLKEFPNDRIDSEEELRDPKVSIYIDILVIQLDSKVAQSSHLSLRPSMSASASTVSFPFFSFSKSRTKRISSALYIYTSPFLRSASLSEVSLTYLLRVPKSPLPVIYLPTHPPSYC